MQYRYRIIFATLLFPLSLICAPSLETHDQEWENKKNAFLYTSIGGYYASYDVKGIDISLGYRRIFGISAFDVNVGGTMIDPIVPYLQGSFLLYPLKWSGPYVGAGLSIVPLALIDDLPSLVNFPFILGYQISGKSHPAFIQFQYSPLIIPGATLSLGVGF